MVTIMGYRGELEVRFRPTKPDGNYYKVGDRVAQLVILPIPFVELTLINTLDTTERGTGGYGSTGN